MVVVDHIGFALETHSDSFAYSRLSVSDIRAFRLNVSGGSMGVEFFFVLSGVVILMAHRRDLGSRSALPVYLWKRFRRIYPIYWIVLPAWMVPYLFFSHHHDPSMLYPYTIVSSVLLIHIGNLAQDLIVSWTLFHEVLFYAVFSIGIVHRKIGQVAFSLWILASVCMLFVPASAWFHEYLFSPLHVLFAWGLFIAWSCEGKVSFPTAWIALGGAAFVSAVALCAVFTEWNPWVQQLAGAGAALLLVGTMTMERSGRLQIPRWLSFLGDASYSIYLIHLLAIVIAIRPAAIIWHRWHPPILLCMLPVFLFAVFFGCIVHLLVERPLLNWFGATNIGSRRHGTVT